MPGRKPIEPKPGEKHGMLTFVKPAGREPSAKIGDRLIYAPLGRWRCDCGNEIVCRNRYVMNGKKKSCGCLIHASGEAWHKGRRLKLPPEPTNPIDNLAAAIRELAGEIRNLLKG